MTGADILGYTAGAITTLTFLPQVLKTWKEKSAKNVSLLMFVIAFVNEVMWIIYGFLKNDWVIILTNIIMIVFCSIMIALKLKYKNV
jgi:MtN3 and saliva related transmembrane protein